MRKRIQRSRKSWSHSRRRLTRPPHRHIEPLPYQRRESLLSRGELAFFRVLSRAIANSHGISLKTRLADVVRCRPELWDTVHGRRLSQKHVDFLVYDRFTAAIVAVVELDDRSHDAPNRCERDAFVNGVFRSLGVAIIRVRAASRYDVASLRRQLNI
jgi:hypothetical protein